MASLLSLDKTVRKTNAHITSTQLQYRMIIFATVENIQRMEVRPEYLSPLFINLQQ